MIVLDLTLCVGCYKYVSCFELWSLWSPFHIREGDIWFGGIDNVAHFTCVYVENPDLPVFACTSYILVLQIEFAAIDFGVWFSQAETVIHLDRCFGIMFD